MKKFSIMIMGIALLSAVVYTGCKKDSTNTNPAAKDNDASAAQDEANATFAMNDSKNISDGAAQNNQSTQRALGLTCGTVIWDSTGATDTMTIHFTGLCISPDLRIRKGDIVVYWAKGKGYFDPNATITQTWRNYSVTTLSGLTIGVTGSTTLQNTGKDSLGDHSWSYNSNIKLSYSTGGTATWNATRNNVLTKIGSVYYYVITGSATGVSKSGVTFSETITSPLYWTAYFINGGALGGKFCDCIEQGTIQFSRTGRANPLILTFTSGVGNCNHTATANINGTSYGIVLP